MILEICANSFASASAAQKAGADRIELCAELSVGGLTPSFGLVEKVRQELDIPVHVLIRPRSGNFTYSEDEITVMLRDIEACKRLGCAGIVTGVLTAANEVDEVLTERLKKAADDMEFTFHRAFDWCIDPKDALRSLKTMGVHRLLSSGQESSAFEGIELLRQLHEASEGAIQVMPGGGISIQNIEAFKQSGFRAVHLSATKKIQTLKQVPKVSMHGAVFFEEGIVATSSQAMIREILKEIQ